MSENVPYTFYLCPSSSLSAPIHASEKKRSKLALAQGFSVNTANRITRKKGQNKKRKNLKYVTE